ncbi:histidine ammonia-lyase [Flexithrix dorotheae]|uniref:histidine ammonia-lyase n=1 Tax=Flexithrix dorotheae TaxID=70993 RepID=UPI00035FBF55|nr:histidine ammonia-lyase [Flexithrix dorotheae]
MDAHPKQFSYGKAQLSVGFALDLVQDKTEGIFEKATIEKITQSQDAVNQIVEKKKTVYGINTGFGPLCTTIISKENTQKLQDNILRSHSVGVGEPIPREIAKLMLVLKVQALSQGFSGIRLSTLERILWHIQQDIIPVVPSQGSVGASGDLAPLAHLFLPLIGLGKVSYKGEIKETAEVFQTEGIEPVTLGPKEGLALINGTQFIAAYGVKVVEKLHNCLATADIIGAMMIEALLGSIKPFQPELHTLRPYKGNIHVAHRISSLLEESEILKSHEDCSRVQDPYSLRCIPQVHGTSRNAWLHLKEILHIELNSVTDNPVIFNANHTISGGNFHGQPLALPLDYATIAACELGNISDRRTYLSLDGETTGLPKLLMKDTGINSGFMLPQYTSAALVSENKSLAFPASADSIPTSLGQEDHVSMGSISGRKALQVIENLEKILAIELLCAAQAFDFRRPLKSGVMLEACHAAVRSKIDHAEEDRVFAHDIEIARQIITQKKLVEISEATAKQHDINLNSEYNELFNLY